MLPPLSPGPKPDGEWENATVTVYTTSDGGLTWDLEKYTPTRGARCVWIRPTSDNPRAWHCETSSDFWSKQFCCNVEGETKNLMGFLAGLGPLVKIEWLERKAFYVAKPHNTLFDWG